MSVVVLFRNEDGKTSIGMPCEWSVEETVARTVPKGIPFILRPLNEVPQDRDEREAWKNSFDFSNPDGYSPGAE